MNGGTLPDMERRLRNLAHKEPAYASVLLAAADALVEIRKAHGPLREDANDA